jgi:quinol monooxygenase YgiN
MPMLRQYLLVCGLLMAALGSPAGAADTAPAAGAYLVTYFELDPSGAKKALALLRQLVADSRKADGNAAFILLVESGRPGRLAMVEAWRDKAAPGARDAAVASFRDAMKPFLAAPFDIRVLSPLAVTPPALADAGLGGAAYVLTHVDVPPPQKDEAIGLVKQLAEDSRKDKGAVRFDVLQQDNRPNHMTVVEIWRDRRAQDDHILTEHTKEFRRKLQPLVGALYDERLYDLLR